MNQYFISISVSELQQWLGDDQLPIVRDRISQIEENERICHLLQRLPAFSIDDEAGVLFVQIGYPDSWDPTTDISVVLINLRDVVEFIPLTKYAEDVLNIRYSSVIALGEPRFEHEFIHFKYQTKSKLSKLIGNRFVNTLINFGSTKFSVRDDLLKHLPRALMAADHRIPKINNLAPDSEDAKNTTSCVEIGFEYTRQKPLKESKELACLLDIGLALKAKESQLLEAKSLINELRDVCKQLKSKNDESKLSLLEIFSDKELIQFDEKTLKKHKKILPVSIISLALFLRWKHTFHEAQGERFNIKAVTKDIEELASDLIDVGHIADALWLLGAYLGGEFITPFCREFHQNEYPSLQFANEKTALKSIDAWKKESSSSTRKIKKTTSTRNTKRRNTRKTVNAAESVAV